MTEIINNVVCPICGCLCDDLEVTVKNNEIDGKFYPGIAVIGKYV